MIDAVKLCQTVLQRLSRLDYEQKCFFAQEQLIFPQKKEKGNAIIDRISEQELRLLFVEEFIKEYPNLYYSIETPTENKYSNFSDDPKVNEKGTSGSLDMSIFNRDNGKYNRLLNVEFKYKNSRYPDIAKDILKLSNEKQNGVFIQLLYNTNNGTLTNNNNESGVFDKFYNSLKKYKDNWQGGKEKFIQIIILSLNKNSKNENDKFTSLINRKIFKSDLEHLEDIFLRNSDLGKNITKISVSDGWENIKIQK